MIACSHLGKPEPDYDKWVKKQTEKGKAPAELTEEAWEKSLKKLTLAPVAVSYTHLAAIGHSAYAIPGKPDDRRRGRHRSGGRPDNPPPSMR